LVINLLLNFFLIPYFMAVGSAIASLVTQFTMALAQVIFVQRIFRFRINYRYIAILVLFVVGVAGFNVLSRSMVIPMPFLPIRLAWLGNFGLMLTASVLLAFLLRLWSFGAFLKIFREER